MSVLIPTPRRRYVSQPQAGYPACPPSHLVFEALCYLPIALATHFVTDEEGALEEQ